MAELLERERCDGLGGVLGHHVLRERDDQAAADLFHQLGKQIGAARHADDTHAFGGEALGDGAADADARAGDDSGFRFEPEVHGRTLSWSCLLCAVRFPPCPRGLCELPDPDEQW